MKIVRVVLDKSVTEAGVDSAAWDLQWSIGKVIKAEGNTSKQAIFYSEEEGEKTFIRYVEDFYIDLPYIEVYGENPNSIELVVEDIHDYITTHSLPEVIDMVKNAKTWEESFLAIRYLGIGCGGQEMTPELLEFFRKLTRDPDRDIREVTLVAMAYTGAAEFKEIFEMLAKNDPDLEVQERAAVSLERLKKYVLAPPTHIKVLDYEDVYEHLAGGDTKIFNPTWEDIEEAIESLNGNSHSVVILQKHRDFIAQEYMVIGGGGNDGMYICFIQTKPPEQFDWKLYDPSVPKDETIEIMASKLMKLSRQDCLYVDDVLKAAKTYTLSGERNSSLHWEKTEELDKEIPWLKPKT